MIEKLKLFFLFLIVTTNLYAQNEKEILNEVFLYYRNGYGSKDIKIGSDFEEFDGINTLSACYTDMNGTIRRFVNYETYPEFVGYTSWIYDKGGNLLRYANGQMDLESNEFGIAFKQHEKNVQKPIKYEYLKEEYLFEESSVKNYAGECVEFSDLFNYFGDLAGCLTSGQAEKTLAEDEYLKIIHKPSTIQRKVIFDRPEIGDFTFVIANNVNIREKPTKQAAIITKAHVGYFVEVKDIVNTENNESWYQIEFLEGFAAEYNNHRLYIYESYLDDTAKTME